MLDNAGAATPESSVKHVAHGSIAESVYQNERLASRGEIVLAALFFLAMLLFAGNASYAGDSFFLRLATEALIMGWLAMSAGILLGFAGLLSLGQALYFGLGAYASALVMRDVQPSFWLAAGAGLAIGVAAGFLGGLIASRVRGVYFALITYGLAQVVSKVVYNTRELGASDGLIGIPIIQVPLGFASPSAGSPMSFFLVVLAGTAIVYLILSYLAGTPFGRLVSALRINQARLPFIGWPAGPIKLSVFILAAALASVGGAFYPMLRGFVSPELMYFEMSTNAVIAVIIGGTGTLIGPLLGAVILVAGKSVIGTMTAYSQIAIGALFMAAVLFFPDGIVGLVKSNKVQPS
jgi:branched-chain amino acid transport system permease protein